MKRILQLLCVFLPAVSFGAGTVSLNQGAGGGTVTIAGGTSAAGSATPAGPIGSVQYSSGSTLGGDTGFQYDSNVSSVTLNGVFQATQNNASIKLDDFGGSGDPTMTFNDNNGTPGGGLRFNYNGVELSRISTYLGFDIYSSTTNSANTAGIRRLSFPIGSSKVDFYNGAGNPYVEFDPLGVSSFTIPVAMTAGFSATAGTFTTLSPGVMHITANSSATVTGLVLSTEASTGLRRTALTNVFNSGGSVLVTSTLSISVPFDCTISSWTILGTTGTVSIHVSTSSLTDFRAGRFYNISAAGNSPSITTDVYNAAAISGWGQSTLTAGDILSFVLDTAAVTTLDTIELWVLKNN